MNLKRQSHWQPSFTSNFVIFNLDMNLVLSAFIEQKHHKNPKNSDIWKICCNHLEIWTRLYHGVMLLKDAHRILKRVDPDQTAREADLGLHCLPMPTVQKLYSLWYTPNNNQRTSGPVTLTWRLVLVHILMLLHMYIAPGQGQTTPWGQMLMSTFSAKMPLSLSQFAANFKKISLKYDFKHILNDFIHIYSPRAGTDNPLGTKFWCQQKFLITLPICCQFQKCLFEVWFFTFFCFFHMYIAPEWGR